MKILSIINQKGGVGKSTTAHAIGAGLASKGYKVLMIDLDPQGNLTDTMRGQHSPQNALTVLLNPATSRGAIQTIEGLDLIPSSPALAGADMQLSGTGKEYKLKEALEPLGTEYSYCIIDTPPALGILTVNALTASTGAIIPAQADLYSLQGIAQLANTIDTIKHYCNPALSLEGILITRYNARSVIKRQIAEELERTAEQLKTKLYQTKIRECTALVEAQATRQSIYDYAPRSNASRDYMAVVEEISL